MKYLLLAGFLLVTGDCQAQQVHKCVDGKNVSYQSQPCAVGQKQAKTWDAPPESAPSYEQQRAAAQRRRQGEAESAYLRRLAGRESLADGQAQPIGAQIPLQRGDACAAAKQRRDAVLKAAGMSRTYSLLQRLDQDVYQACK